MKNKNILWFIIAGLVLYLIYHFLFVMKDMNGKTWFQRLKEKQNG